MSEVLKCDGCGQLDDPSNEVDREQIVIELTASGLRIIVAIPQKLQYRHLCQECVHKIISARFTELCGLLTPYQPARVQGFIQGGADEEPITTEERKALTVLSRRLLKA